jgi:hypothetical protein
VDADHFHVAESQLTSTGRVAECRSFLPELHDSDTSRRHRPYVAVKAWTCPVHVESMANHQAPMLIFEEHNWMTKKEKSRLDIERYLKWREVWTVVVLEALCSENDKV